MGIEEKKKKIINICSLLGVLLIGFYFILTSNIPYRLFGFNIKIEIGFLLSGIGILLVTPQLFLYAKKDYYEYGLFLSKAGILCVFLPIIGICLIIYSINGLMDTYTHEFSLCFRPLSICLVAFFIINKVTKGRCEKKEYLITVIIVIILQVFILYPLLFYFFFFKSFYLLCLVLMLLFCVNIYISIKRFYDSVISENKKFIAYLSPLINLFIYLFALVEVCGFFKPKVYLFSFILLTLINIIPIIILYSKDKDINIKPTDIPINYRLIFSKYCKDKYIVKIAEDYIYINYFRFSVSHTVNRHTITSYNGIDNDNLLVKYFKENGIRKLGIHYMSIYYDLTDVEYNKMLVDIKSMENVIFIENIVWWVNKCLSLRSFV